jgi:hypothetical protein
VLVGSTAGVALVVVVVDLLASGPGFMLVVVVLDLTASDPGVELVSVVVDLVTSAAVPRASSIIVAMSMATNIFFISKPLFSYDLYEQRLSLSALFYNVFRDKRATPAFQAVIPPGGMSLPVPALIPPE